MSSNDNAGDLNTYATAETAFTTSVVALNSAASSTEICGYVHTANMTKGVARTLNGYKYAHQREATETSSDSVPFQNGDLS